MLGEKNHFYGKHHTKETLELISSKTKEGMKNILPRTKEHNKKISRALIGTIFSKERCENISKSKKGKIAWNKGKKSKTIICPYCLKEGGISNMKRWHFNNCKEKI